MTLRFDPRLLGLTGLLLLLLLPGDGHAQGRPSLVDLDARLTQVVDGLCAGDASTCGIASGVPVAGQVDLDGGALVVDFHTLTFAFDHPSGSSASFDLVQVEIAANEFVPILLDWIDTQLTLNDLTVLVPDSKGGGSVTMLTFGTVTLQRLESTGANGRATLHFAFRDVTFDWLGSTSSWDSVLSTGSGCTVSAPAYVSLAGNDSALLGPGEHAVDPFAFGLYAPVGGGQASTSFEFSGPPNAVSACLLQTGAGGGAITPTFDRLSPLSGTLSTALKEHTVQATSGSIASYRLDIEGATLRESVTLQLGAGSITSRTFDPTTGAQQTASTWTF